MLYICAIERPVMNSLWRIFPDSSVQSEIHTVRVSVSTPERIPVYFFPLVGFDYDRLLKEKRKLFRELSVCS